MSRAIGVKALVAAGALAVGGTALTASAVLYRADRPANTSAAARTTAAQNQFPYREYDGRFTFVRVQYDISMNQGGGRNRGGGGNNPPWYHDYPIADRALSAIISEITHLRTSATVTNIMRLDNPEIFKFPILYLSEPGRWTPSESEVVALRAYLTKGGFIIFDDFGGGGEWQNFAYHMKRTMPDLTPMPLDGTEPMWRTFFDIEPSDIHMSSYRGEAEFFGLFEDNDRSKRMIAMINFNNDIGEIMEYSADGFYPVDLSNQAFKFGVNFIIYAVSH